MKKLAVSAVVILALAIAACGGGSGSSSGSTTTGTTVRTIKGTISAPAAITISSEKVAAAGTCSAYTPPICRVIATSTDGTTVMDESLADCAFSLGLTIGKEYVISFVGTNSTTGACDTFVATLLAGTSGSVFSIRTGEGDIDLGTISVDPTTGSATFSATFTDILSCDDLGLADDDSDGMCNGADGEVPAADDFAGVVECASSSDCTEGKTCNDAGFCSDETPPTTAECTEDANCEALHPGEGKVCDAADGTCKAPTFSIGDLEGSYQRTSFEGAAGCETYINRMSEVEGVAVTGADVVMTGDDTTGGCNPETVPVIFTPTQTGSIFEAVSVLVRECPVEINDRQTNTITFDASATPITLVREITAREAGNIQFPSESIGCKGIYEKQP